MLDAIRVAQLAERAQQTMLRAAAGTGDPDELRGDLQAVERELVAARRRGWVWLDVLRGLLDPDTARR